VEDLSSLTRIISEVSAGFIDLDPQDIDEGIANAVRLIGGRLDLDGTHLGFFTDDRASLRLAHRFMNRGLVSTIEEFRSFPVAGLPWASARILAGDPVVIPAVDQLPPEATAERMLLQSLDAQSVVIMPLQARGVAQGIIGFATRAPREFSAEVLQCMRLTAEIIGSALDRKRTDAALRERLAFEETLSRVATRQVSASVDEIDRAIDDALHALAGALRYVSASLVPPEELERFGAPKTELAAGRIEQHGDLTLVPLKVEERLVGSLAFLGSTATPSEAVRARLTLVGDLVAASIARKQSEVARREAYVELQRSKWRVEVERDYLREETVRPPVIVGSSRALERLLEVVDAVSTTAATVLLRGESGVGKELVARAIHDRSQRRAGPLVRVNCASVPKHTFESEFFGHVKDAFPGAHQDRAGRFELAEGGTLFLDEVGEIPLELQARLLRVLQEAELERVGDHRTVKVDVRVIAATNRNLDAAVVAGRFRQDLYYRLSAFPIDIPPLRDRLEDVAPLAEHFLLQAAAKLGRTGLHIGEAHRRQLLAYQWPGNVRELKHVIERAVILSPQPPLELAQALAVAQPVRESPVILRDDDLRSLERSSIANALERSGGRVAGPGGAAELLGMRPSTLRDRMKALGIHRMS
jgi:transcriptional regulator with GAF, ATPase, and Fis domain